MFRVRLIVGAAVIIALAGPTAAQPMPDAAPGPDAAPPDAAPADAAPPPEPVPVPVPVPVPDSGLTPLPGPVPPKKGAKLTPEERDRIRRACELEAPDCDQVALLGSLEQQTLERGLVARGLEIDPAPWGKVVGTIHVYNSRVFSERDGFLQFFNHFHRTSREHVVEREVVLRPGEVWKQSKIDETSRRLRNPVFTSLAAVLPVRSAEPGKVDILVVTRDVWSLRMNTEYAVQDQRLTYLTASLSENNFLGLHKLVSLTYEMDLNTAGIGPVYYDRNLYGKRIDFYTRIYALFNRDDLWDRRNFEYEGSQSIVRVNRPLWNLDEEWGGGVEFRHNFSIERRFQQDEDGHIGIRTYDDPSTPEVEAVPYEYDTRTFSLSTGGVRGFGESVEHRVKAGHQLVSQNYRVADDFMFPPPLQTAFEQDVLPRSEVTSSLYLGYEVFLPKYREFRNVGGFDLAEDLRLGPSAETTLSFALELLGSDQNFMRIQQTASYVLPWGADGALRIGGSINLRAQAKGPETDNHRFIDNTASAETRVVTPTLFGWIRFVNEIRIATLWHETQNRFLSLGGDTGLRGFGINQFDGLRRLVMQSELRTAPIPILFTRWGLVAFYDVGGAAASLKSMTFHSDVGLGVRVLLPQMSSQILRFDFAFPLDGPTRGQFRFTAGFMSAF
jgi:hypothetical protein